MSSSLGTKMAAWDWTSPLGRQFQSQKLRRKRGGGLGELLVIKTNDLFPLSLRISFFRDKYSYNELNLKFWFFFSFWFIQNTAAICVDSES